MAVTVVVGAQWGDEGKGKVVDALSAEARCVARFQGGANAGHTLVVGGRRHVLHLVPSGIFREGCLNVVGPEVVVHLPTLVEELDAIEALGVQVDRTRLLVSQRAPLVLPWHRALDALRERRRGGQAIGTTLRGIGPAREDAVGRQAVLAGHLRDVRDLRARLEALGAEKNALIEALGGEPIAVEAVWRECEGGARRIADLLGDAGQAVRECIERGDAILCEGAQGTLLDVTHGTWPWVTSSHTIAAGAAVSLGFGPRAIDRVVGVAKAYVTRVGGGPFPTEAPPALAERLRAAGGEFGATTGRPRRCGWLDLPALRLARDLNGLTGLVITKLDVLDGFDEIPVCVGYALPGGERTERFVAEGAEPIWRQFAGWRHPVRGVRRWADLPAEARAYLAFIEESTGVRVDAVGVGPGRDELVEQS